MTNQHSPRTPAAITAAEQADIVHTAARRAEFAARGANTVQQAKVLFWNSLREQLKQLY